LIGSENWLHWSTRFENVLREVSPIHWAIIDGAVFPPTCEQRQAAAETSNKSPADEQLNNDLRFWNQANKRAGDYLRQTLSPETAEDIAGVDYARDAWLELKELYFHRRKTENLCHQWARWIDIRYRGTGSWSKKEFVSRFQKALDELRYLNFEITPAMEFAQFMCAVKENPDCKNFCAYVYNHLDVKNDMGKVYSLFLIVKGDRE
jgi:hypothetical protein